MYQMCIIQQYQPRFQSTDLLIKYFLILRPTQPKLLDPWLYQLKKSSKNKK